MVALEWVQGIQCDSCSAVGRAAQPVPVFPRLRPTDTLPLCTRPRFCSIMTQPIVSDRVLEWELAWGLLPVVCCAALPLAVCRPCTCTACFFGSNSGFATRSDMADWWSAEVDVAASTAAAATCG